MRGCEQFCFNHPSFFVLLQGGLTSSQGASGQPASVSGKGKGRRGNRGAAGGQANENQANNSQQLKAENSQRKADNGGKKGQSGQGHSGSGLGGSGSAGQAKQHDEGWKEVVRKSRKVFCICPPFFSFSFQSSFKSSTFACVGQFDYFFYTVFYTY